LKTSEERLKGMAKRCPGVGCMFYVEKDGGCDCIVCCQCGCEWIWDAVGFEGEEALLKMDGEGGGIGRGLW